MDAVARPPKHVVEAAVALAAEMPELADPEMAYGRCAYAAAILAERIPGAEVVNLVGCRTSFPDRVEDYRDYDDPDPHIVHAACRVGDWYVDATRRQFDPSCEHPHICHATEFESEWMRITTGEPDLSDEALDALRAELDDHLGTAASAP